MNQNNYLKIKKRKYYNTIDYDVDLKNQQLVLKQQLHDKLLNNKMPFGKGFKKITGTVAGDVLGLGSFGSQFKAFVRMSWLDMPILDLKYIKAGIAIEPKVIELLMKQPGIKQIKTFPAEKYNYDFFSNVDPIIGGLPDGLVLPQNIVIEIKTTGKKNLKNWDNYGIPINYIKQVELYTYLMKLEKYAIVATFLEPEDYELPEKLNIKTRKTKTYFREINMERTKDDVKKIKQWYNTHKKLGISPEFDEQKDCELIDYLVCSNEDEWKTLLEKWDKQGKINWASL